MLEELVALIAPPACAVCGGGSEIRERLCDGCEGALRGLAPVWSPVPGVDIAWAAARYEGTARNLVGALKFGSRVALADEAASLIAARAPGEVLDGTIVPVPPAPLRRRRRGFDSAEMIAAALGKRRGLPLVPCLGRTQGRRQVGRRRAERLADPPRVRVLSPAPSHAILVDDVMTTGATLRVVAVTLAASRPARRPLGLSVGSA
jgi:predicted amidophosphoribosyltransferase